MRNHPAFSEHDCSLSLWVDDPKDAALAMLRNVAVRHLRGRGFQIGLDPHTKRHYKCISKDHHRGRRGDLEIMIDLSGRHLEIKFFQNVVRDNQNGGQYDFDKRAKMPYLLGKRYEVERNRLARLFASYGFELATEGHLTGIDFIRSRQGSLSDFQGRDFYARPRYSYNITSAGRREIRDGDVVYFRDEHDGYVRRGVAHYNINNMWWVLLPSGEVRNRASFELSHREHFVESLRGRKVADRIARQRIDRHKAAAVKAEQFERAAKLRDALRIRFPEAA